MKLFILLLVHHFPVREVGQLRLPDDEIGSSDTFNIRELLKETARRMTKGYLARGNSKRKNEQLRVGMYAWVKVEESLENVAVKLSPKWTGPYKIIHVVDDGRAYQLENVFDGSVIKRAAEKLKIYVDRDDVLDELKEKYSVEDDDSDGSEEEGVVPSPRVRRPPQRLEDYVIS